MSDDFESKSDEIKHLASMPPEAFADHLEQTHNTLDAAAPNLAPHFYSTASRAVSYLNSKLPTASLTLPQDPPYKPSELQKRSWLKLHEVVDDPLKILENLHTNQVNSEHIEAIQNIYPDLYGEMKQKIMENLGTFKMQNKLLPYQRKLSISKFLGEPLDSTMSLGGMQSIMKANAGAQTQTQGQPGQSLKASGTTLTQINKVNSLYETPSQARAKDRVTK